MAVYSFLVPGLGLEPRLPGPEPDVLPLDDPGIWVSRVRGRLCLVLDHSGESIPPT